MARQNTKQTPKFNTFKNPETTTNLAGGPAFHYPPETELILRCASNFMEDNYYASEKAITKEIKRLVYSIGEKNPVFIMKLAGWLRNEMNMRSVSIYLLALMAGHPSYRETIVKTKDGREVKQGVAKPWLEQYAPYIMIRADEPAETLAAFQAIYPGEKVPQALYKAISSRLNKLSAYEAIKYRTEKRTWSLKDVIRVVHPKPTTDSGSYLFNWIVNGEASVEGAKEAGLNQLASYLMINKAENFEDVDVLDGTTWEFLTSKFGSHPEVWQAASKVMAPFAYVRNLRNLLEKTDGMHLDYDKIVRSGKGNKILPFRFLTAKKVMNGMNDFSIEVKNVKKALEEAVELSVANVPNLGNVAILLDYSGSMSATVSSKSEMTRSDVAKVFAAAAFKRADNAMIIEYDTRASVVQGIEKEDRLFAIVDRLKKPSGGTSIGAAMELAMRYVDNMDMVYILTDEQSWVPNSGGYGADYMGRMFGKKGSLKVVNHNLGSLGTSELPQDKRILDIGGWSDQVFSVVDLWNKGGIVKMIENWCVEVREED